VTLGKPRGRTVALFLIAAGAFLFLDNTGIIPVHDLDAWWPVWMIVVGGLIVEHRRSFLNVQSVVSLIWAAGWILCGILLILGNLHVLPVNEEVIWPILLIVIGTIMLVRPVSLSGWQSNFAQWQVHAREAAFERRRLRRERRRGWAGVGTRDVFAGDRLREAIVFSSLNRRLETQQFEGGTLEVVFGSIEVDLSEAAISSPERRAVLELSAVFGGIEIIVPRTWKVVLQATAVFGGCDNKTLPPRPEPGVEPATLLITGGAVFGGITIQN
jgi:predicted membrane protein